MGSLLSRDNTDYLLEIRKLSQNKVNLDDINYLQIQTTFTPQQMHSLYLKFIKLGSPLGASISIYEFMRLEDIINCPLMPRLAEGLDLKYELEQYKAKVDIENVRNALDQQQQQQQQLQQNQKKESNKKGEPVFKGKQQKKIIIDNSTVMLQSGFSSFKNNVTQLDIKFIDFKLFVRLLNVFSPNTSSGQKTKFMFRIYDFDNDGILSFNDIFLGVKMMYSDHNLNECKLSDGEITALVQRLFSESDISQDEGFKYEDFQLNLWETDFEKQCTIYF